MAEAKTFHAVVDRIVEGTHVVIFDERLQLHLDRKYLPKGTTESSVLKVTFELDPAEEARRVGSIRAMQERLLKRTRAGK